MINFANIKNDEYTQKLNRLSSNIENLKTQLESNNMHKYIQQMINN